MGKVTLLLPDWRRAYSWARILDSVHRNYLAVSGQKWSIEFSVSLATAARLAALAEFMSSSRSST